MYHKRPKNEKETRDNKSGILSQRATRIGLPLNPIPNSLFGASLFAAGL